ncbi:GTP 3',8-cyclase MoaA [Niabella terrae]
MLTDQYNRVHDYLRISLTDHCNFRCLYCMPDADYQMTPAARLMQPAEILSLARTFVDLGVRKIRLTGGEPLVRKDAAEIISALAALPVELALTTNGSRLHLVAPLLQQTGIRSLNISLDSLQPEKFLMITKRKGFGQVMRNIAQQLRRNIELKINVVVIAGLNDDELLDFVEWTREQPVQIRFIEFMPFTGNQWDGSKVFTWQQMLERIGARYPFVPVATGPHDTAKKYQVPGHAGSFAVISTMSAPFCSSCNRMRLTADGKLKNCLFAGGETDLLSVIRSGEDPRQLIIENIAGKARELGGQFTKDFKQLDTRSVLNRSMIAIGG